MFELWKEALPEFKDAYFFTSGPTAGSRESRRIVGDYMLTGDDIRTAQRQDDVVVLGAWRIDRHPKDAAGYHDQPIVPPYDISYRTLLPQGRRESLGCGSLSLGNFRGPGIKSSHSQLNGHGAGCWHGRGDSKGNRCG